jgi:outer membrane protein TolC
MNRGDVLKLELAVSEAKARVAQARAMREIAHAALREAMGLPAGTQMNLAATTPPVDVDKVTDVETAIKTALERRPEPRQTRGSVEVAGFAKKLSYSNFSPGLNVFVKWDKNFGEPAGMGATDEVQRTYGLQATWDLWNNGSHVFAVREAAQRVAMAEEGLRGLEQQIRLELTQTLANLRAAEESLLVAQTAVAQAEEAYRIEKVRFQSGSRSATDLIFAEASQVNAQGRLVTAQADLVSWQLKLQRALGDTQPKFR